MAGRTEGSHPGLFHPLSATIPLQVGMGGLPSANSRAEAGRDPQAVPSELILFSERHSDYELALEIAYVWAWPLSEARRTPEFTDLEEIVFSLG